MSYLDKLLEGVAVEWKPLGESLVRTKGTSITAAQMKVLHKENAPLKIFAGGKTVAFVNFEDIPQKDINREPSIIVKSRGVIEFDYYDKPFTHKNEMWSYHSKNEYLNIKFVYYFLNINEPYFQNIGNRMNKVASKREQKSLADYAEREQLGQSQQRATWAVGQFFLRTLCGFYRTSCPLYRRFARCTIALCA